MENIIESSNNVEPVVNVEPQTEVTTIEPVNAGVEEVTPSNVEKPVQSAEDNAKYAAIRREAEQKAYIKAQDELIASMYGESDGIYTKADYDKAVKAEQERQQLEELKQNVPEEFAKEIIESRKDREERAKEKAELAKQLAKEKDFNDFIDIYPNVKSEEVPQEVWQEVEKGKSLVDAYAKFELKTLKAKLAEYEKGTKTLETNKNNAAATTGSLTGNGAVQGDYITKEQFEANKRDNNWLSKNYDLLKSSMNKW